MKRARWLGVGATLGLATAAGTGAFQDDGGPAGPVTSFLRVVRGKFFDARTSVRNNGLVHQVETRLRQDKNLEADQIEISVEEESTVLLKGQVADADDKEKAVLLARDTRGVLKVVDQLAVLPPTRVFNAPEAETKRADVADRSRVIR